MQKHLTCIDRQVVKEITQVHTDRAVMGYLPMQGQNNLKSIWGLLLGIPFKNLLTLGTRYACNKHPKWLFQYFNQLECSEPFQHKFTQYFFGSWLLFRQVYCATYFRKIDYNTYFRQITLPTLCRQITLPTIGSQIMLPNLGRQITLPILSQKELESYKSA